MCSGHQCSGPRAGSASAPSGRLPENDAPPPLPNTSANASNNSARKSAVLAVAIISSPTKWAYRAAQRETWLQYEAVRSGAVQVRYFVGQQVGAHQGSPAADINACLLAEAARYGDMELLAWHNESYRAISAKLMPILTWGAATAPAVMKTDDDVFLRLPLLLRHLEKLQPKSGSGDSSDVSDGFFAWARFQMHSFVLRSGKWAMPMKTYAKKFYPPFPSGPGYVLSAALATYLVRAVNAGRFHPTPMEDVSIGLWLERMQKEDGRVVVIKNSGDKFCATGCTNSGWLSHYIAPTMMRCIWQNLRSDREACTNCKLEKRGRGEQNCR